MNVEFLSRNKHPKPIITSIIVATTVETSVETAMATHLNDVNKIKLANKPLRVLTDSGGDENFINQQWTMFGKKGEKMYIHDLSFWGR